MASSQSSSLRQVRGAARRPNSPLNVIIENDAMDEIDAAALKTGNSNFSVPVMMVMESGFSASSAPACRGYRPNVKGDRWAHDRRISFDELYDATDESSEEECPSLSSKGDTRSSTGSYTLSTGSSAGQSQEETSFPKRRNRYPTILIPTTDWQGSKSSSVPPTPPPKIPISPQVMSALQRAVPGLHNPPSLSAESQASERASTTSLSSPQTPNLDAVSDVDWDQQENIQLHVDSDSLSLSASVPSTTSMSPQSDVQLEYHQDWDMVLNQFPPVPAGARAVGLGSTHGSNTPSEREHEGENRTQASVRVSNAGVLLSSAALETLQHIEVYESSARSSSPSEVDEIKEMHELLDSAGRPKSMSDVPESAGSGTSFSSLSVPSPGGFFSSLDGPARRTWAFPSHSVVPTSAIAERFYNCPWRPLEEGNVVEQIVECADDDDDDDGTTEGPPTAKAVLSPPTTARRVPEEQPDDQQLLKARLREPGDNTQSDYYEGYEQELQSHAMANLDRTSMWLQSQTVDAPQAKEDVQTVNSAWDGPSVQDFTSPVESAVPGPTAKGVRFLEPIQEESATTSSPPSTPLPPIPTVVPKNSIFYRGFQHATNPRQGRNLDTFLQSNFRYEAVQAARLSMMQKHVSYLNGKYELSNPYRPPYRGPFAQAPRNSTLPQVLSDKAMFDAIEKEQDVLNQLKTSTWAIDALRYLNGNRLIPSPAAKRLEKSASSASDSSPSSTRSRQIRVLDLGGHATCEWAWHIAREYPSAKVYSAVTFHQPVNSGLKGPANHEYVSVHKLWKLPFANNQFDLISARSLHMLLKSNRTMMADGRNGDEFDLCLQECFRCLKPRGFLEYMLIDSEIARAGPYGSATSVEFGFNLKTRGYDPCPTKRFLPKLRKANFSAIKRAWMFLPMGSPTCIESPVPGLGTHATGNGDGDAAANATGSTADVASITGLLGGWMWEQWMLKLQTEMGREDEKLLEGMPALFEEGRKSGAGWRCLNGWAMKPKAVK